MQGGGDISFDIDGAGVPSIAVASPLPAISTSVMIDGTTQDDGFVSLTGGGETLLTLVGGTSRVTGLVIDQTTDAVTVTGGSDHVIEGNRFGTDAAGTAEGDVDFGVLAKGSSGLVVRDNVIVVGEGGVAVAPEVTGVQIVGNSVGVNASGTASLGDPASAVLISGPDAEVRDNVMRGDMAGVEVVGAAAAGAKIEGNAVGLNESGTAAFPDMGYGIRVDGAPGVTISANKVSSPGWAAILVSGTVQVEVDDDGTYNLISPGSEVEDQPVTGGAATIAGNTIGVVSGNQASDPAIQRGVYTWSGADDVTVSANTIGGATNSGIELETGARHKITGNRIGTDASGSTEVAVHEGITLSKTTDVTIGGTGSDANKIVAESQGVNLIGTTATTNVAGNTIGGANGAGNFYGIYAGQGATGVALDSNVITKGTFGIRNETAGTTITKNTVSNFTEFGIKSRGWTATITGNVSSGNGVGISASGKDLNVSLNRVGLDGATETVIGNTGRGIDIGEASTAELTRNVVAGSGAQGIHVINGSTATLRANRILSSTAKPIDAAGAPAAPNLVAAVRATSGTSTRTTLILNDLPKGDAGTIEVFANESCSDPEAEIVMDISRTKKVDEEVRIIQIIVNATRDNYTVTYTDAGGHTSELSGCVEAKSYGDADGDGSQDPFDAILGQKDDPPRP